MLGGEYTETMNKWSAVVILAIAQFVMILDSTVMNVSISTIVEDLDTTVNALQGAITLFTLTMAALMLIGAKLGTKWGLLRTFVIGSIIYGIGSLITGLSPNIAILTAGWSIIEGTGAVLVIPAIAALVAVNYKGRDRVTAFAIIGGVSGIAAAAGPLIGGFMTTYLSWRYVFFCRNRHHNIFADCLTETFITTSETISEDRHTKCTFIGIGTVPACVWYAAKQDMGLDSSYRSSADKWYRHRAIRYLYRCLCDPYRYRPARTILQPTSVP